MERYSSNVEPYSPKDEKKALPLRPYDGLLAAFLVPVLSRIVAMSFCEPRS